MPTALVWHSPDAPRSPRALMCYTSLHVLTMHKTRTRQKRIQLPWHDTVTRADETRRNWRGAEGGVFRPITWDIMSNLSFLPAVDPRSQCKLTADSQLHLNNTDTTKLGSSQHFKWSVQIGVPTGLWPVKYISCIMQILPWVFRRSGSGSNALKAL